MNAIVAVDKRWGIGKNNDLLFKLPEDMKFFRKMTMGKIIVMGSNTLKSFPGSKPLPDRTNVVLYPGGENREDCKVVQNLEELKDYLKNFPSEDIFIVGGAMFYSTMIDYCDRAYITKVDADGGATHFFKNLDEILSWEIKEQSEEIETGGYKIKFTVYKNREPKKFF